MYFDTHAHYNSEAFDADRHEIMAELPQKGVTLVLNPGCDRESSEAAISYAQQYPHIYAAIGWHPHEVKEISALDTTWIREAAQNPKVVAVGEIGLDYYYEYSPREIQKTCFIEQMELARELSLPVIIHDRDAHADTMEIIRKYPDVLGVFHCYSGSVEMAEEILRLGWYLSFTGAITFKNARRSLEVIAAVPMDRIMIETDAPYLTPTPHRGKRNDSSYLPLIAQTIGDVKGCSGEEIANITMENGCRFFHIQ